jgi:HK97 family phage major capsid protein
VDGGGQRPRVRRGAPQVVHGDGAGAPSRTPAPTPATSRASRSPIGQQFVESAGYKGLIAAGLKGGSWSTGDVEVKTLLSEAAGGAATVATPTVLPGVVDIRFQPLTIADLFAQGTTTTPLIRYLVESSVTNAAAATAEGGTKPESALAFTNVDEPVRKIATFLPVTDEMLEDYAQTQSYIDNRLSLFVQIAEEAQLLSGSGPPRTSTGILNRSGLAPRS